MSRYQLGQRVRTLVDAHSLWNGGWGCPSGTGGVVSHVDPGLNAYGVLLDGDPSGLSASFDASELEAELS